jgi:dihydrodipicolinate synthase/N-acetylneuraminate lyase
VSHTYSRETGAIVAKAIVADFLEALEAQGDVAPAFMAELRQLAQAGELANAGKVQQAVEALRAQLANVQMRESGGRERQD